MDQDTDDWLLAVFRKSMQHNALNPKAKVRLICFQVAYALAKTHGSSGLVDMAALTEMTNYRPMSVWTGLAMLQTIGGVSLAGSPHFDLQNDLVAMCGTSFSRSMPRLQVQQ